MLGRRGDLEARLKKHKSGKGARYLKMFKSFELIYTEEFDTRSEAMRRESELKALTKQEKEKLVEL